MTPRVSDKRLCACSYYQSLNQKLPFSAEQVVQLLVVREQYGLGVCILSPSVKTLCQFGENLDFSDIHFDIFLNFSEGLTCIPRLNCELGSQLVCNKHFWNGMRDGYVDSWMGGYGNGR